MILLPSRVALSLLLVAACLQQTAWAERRFDEADIVINSQPRHYYHLHDEPAAAGDAALPTILLIDGSGCSDFAPRVPGFFEKYPAGIDLYLLEKPGIVKGSKGVPTNACTAEYVRADYQQKRVDDALAFLATEPQLRLHGPKSIAVVGFSEGGEIAPYVAKESKKIGWLVTAGAGAMRQGDAFLIFADRGVEPFLHQYQRDALMREYVAIAKDPDNLDKQFFGHSYKYWSSHLFDDQLPTWAALDIHMVAAMGSKDESGPIEAGYRLRDYFAAHPDKDFQFVEYKGGAHNLKVGDKDNLQTFLANLAKWFRGEANPFAHD